MFCLILECQHQNLWNKKFNELDKFLSNPKNSTDKAKYWNSLTNDKKKKALNSFAKVLKKGEI